MAPKKSVAKKQSISVTVRRLARDFGPGSDLMILYDFALAELQRVDRFP